MIDGKKNQIPTPEMTKINSHLENMRTIGNGQTTKETETIDTDVAEAFSGII
jgi:hypothetical protein